MPFVNRCGGQSAELQSKIVTPSTTQQIITPDVGYDGLSQVTIQEAEAWASGSFTAPAYSSSDAQTKVATFTFNDGSDILPTIPPKRIWVQADVSLLLMYYRLSNTIAGLSEDYMNGVEYLYATRGLYDETGASYTFYIACNTSLRFNSIDPKQYGTWCGTSNGVLTQYNPTAKTFRISFEQLTGTSTSRPAFSLSLGSGTYYIDDTFWGVSGTDSSSILTYRILCTW